jgi:sugar lactone lactonase YvrE
MRIEVVGEVRAGLGESPVWDERHQQLWWVDALVGHLHRWDANTGATTRVEFGCRLGGLALADRELVVMADSDVVVVSRDPEEPIEPRTLHRTEAGLHDCGVAPDGTIWVGTLSPDPDGTDGGMLRVGAAEITPIRLVEGYRMPNGISWTADGSAVHIVDSLRHRIYRSRFVGGREVEREPWVVAEESDGLPDGVCADQDDGLWVAYWGSGHVVRYDAAGRRTHAVQTPARYTTSCCFGGPGLRHLFITSARHDAVSAETEAGALFVVELDIPGLPVPTAWSGPSVR